MDYGTIKVYMLGFHKNSSGGDEKSCEFLLLIPYIIIPRHGNEACSFFELDVCAPVLSPQILLSLRNSVLS